MYLYIYAKTLFITQNYTALKKFTFLAITLTFLLSIANVSVAQQKTTQNTTNSALQRCGTTEWVNNMIAAYPGFNEQYEASERMLGDAINRYLEQQRVNPNRVNAPIVIPIVFHVVLANQATVTDAMIMNQLMVLNRDYAGTNADSTNISYAPQFQAVRGHSDIQFCLAQRTPTNMATTGINRITSSTVSTGSSANDPIKSTAAGGTDAWDPNKYFNVWVGNFSGGGLLGYASFPIGSPENPGGNITQQGIVVLGQSLPGGTAAPYNLGRTAVHEAGHFFWLRHVNGDAACGNDFPTTPALDDTPLQSNLTSGCPTGPQATGCTSPTPPGRMYQNYMDYTYDACYSMFTNGQNTRSYQAINTFRPSLLTSNGCIPPILTNNNASIFAIVTPTASFVTCDPTVPLTVTLRNSGLNALTSVTITVKRNATTIQTLAWTGNLASMASTSVALNPVPLAMGINSIEVCTSIPNGVADTDPSDDCKTVTGSRGGGSPLPLVEGFENFTFPPTGWLIEQAPPDAYTWTRNLTGVAHGGTANAYINHYAYGGSNQTDDLKTANYSIGTADSMWVSFWGAYRGYPGFPFESFQVLASRDCGQTFQTVYSVRNDTAFVAPDGSPITTTANYFPAALNHWVQKSVDISSFIASGNVQVKFRSINSFGNNFFLDDINLDKKIFFNNDAGVITINRPFTNICISSEAPVATIKNFGKIPLTSVKINFQVDGVGPIITFNWTGNLVRNQTATVTLPVATYGAVGNHTIRIFTSDPNNVLDEDPSNDALTKAVIVNQVYDLPGSVTEEFTATTFPPANWAIVNPNADMTWARNATVGKKNPGSAWFNDFINNTIDRTDDLGMPNYKYSNIDSIFLTYNLSTITKTFPGTTGVRLDTLTVLLSKDCGNTFTTVSKKWGEELQSVNDPNFQISLNNFVPLSNQWKMDSVNLGRWLGATEPLFKLLFRFSGNFENNFYLDDVNVRTEVLPARLKAEGQIVLPNPFKNSFGVWHYQMPKNLRYVTVYNAAGQRVWSKQFNGNAEKMITVDLANRAAGMYSVHLGYEDSNRDLVIPIVKY